MNASIVDRMAARGFALDQTGGGCTAFARTDGEIEEIVTLADEPKAPTALADEVTVATREEGGEAETLTGYTMADVLAALENPSDEYFLLELRLHNWFHRATSV